MQQCASSVQPDLSGVQITTPVLNIFLVSYTNIYLHILFLFIQLYVKGSPGRKKKHRARNRKQGAYFIRFAKQGRAKKNEKKKKSIKEKPQNLPFIVVLNSILFVFRVYLKPKYKNTFLSIFKRVKNRLPAVINQIAHMCLAYTTSPARNVSTIPAVSQTESRMSQNDQLIFVQH